MAAINHKAAQDFAFPAHAVERDAATARFPGYITSTAIFLNSLAADKVEFAKNHVDNGMTISEIKRLIRLG